MKHRSQRLSIETLECRQMLDASLHNEAFPVDVNVDGVLSPSDALIVISYLNGDTTSVEIESQQLKVDVNNDSFVSPKDALIVITHLNQAAGEAVSAAAADKVFSGEKAPGVDNGDVGTFEFEASFSDKEGKVEADPADPAKKKFTVLTENLLTEEDVRTLLRRASMATDSEDAIIAVVDRSGNILGVRVEKDVNTDIVNDPEKLAFAIDGAVAKARTAAFFSSNAAPLTSRTIRFISQTTITQREVESSPTNDVLEYRGPGLVAPIGVGGHFPPEIKFTPQVDLFAIEHQSRDSQTHPGADREKGTADDFDLYTRFNADPQFIPTAAEKFFMTWPESYGEQSDTAPNSIPRGIGTLPGGVPLFKFVTDPPGPNLSDKINLVGGIGVFFPGDDGYATYEQNFVNGIGQTEKYRTNAPKVLEAEFAALIAAAGSGVGLFSPMTAFDRDLTEFNKDLPKLDNFLLPTGRIDLVGITLEIYGPTPSRAHRIPGIDRLIEVGRALNQGVDSSRLVASTGEFNEPIEPVPTIPGMERRTELNGQPVPEGWLVAPHGSKDGLTADDVQQIIESGIEEAKRTRAAIRLDIDNGFRPGSRTRMVLAVADKDGELLGLFRMTDTTIFSIDVSVAKARNTSYYADAQDLVSEDQVDFNGDGTSGSVSTSIRDGSGDTFDPGTALTNRSIRFLAEPRFPTGIELPQSLAFGLESDSGKDLCNQKPVGCREVGPQSMLRLPGINPLTAENLKDKSPLSFEVYASDTSHRSTVAFDSFNVMRNFRDPGDAEVVIAGSEEMGNKIEQPLANQNGVVFFPGSTPLYVDNRMNLAGGFGVSGDGVDQDDVVTSAGQQGFDPLQSIRVDSFTIGGIRVPFQHFNRNPFGA